MDITEALELAAAGRKEYAHNNPSAIEKAFLLGQAAGYSRAADVIRTNDVLGFLADECPSWRWPEEVHDMVMGK